MSNHDGEDFEKANLLLAKFYIDKSKNDLAQEMCKKILVENKSCSQAWEILGLIFEKESNYEMAADAYQKVHETFLFLFLFLHIPIMHCYIGVGIGI